MVQIEVLMHSISFLMGNSARSGEAMHEMFLGSKKSLFGVYFGSDLVPINEYGFGSHKVQSWFELIKMLRSDQICMGLIS
jgi:hypothetical protein